MNVECLDAAALTPADAAAIAALRIAVWPKPERNIEDVANRLQTQWRAYPGPGGQAPRHFLVRGPKRVLATAHIFPRTVDTAAGEMTIMALAGVCVTPEERGKNLGLAVVEAALTVVDEGSFRYSLFQTTEDVRSFYEKLGACAARNRIVNSLAEEPQANPFWGDVIMRYPNTPGWPEGTIDLLGPGY